MFKKMKISQKILSLVLITILCLVGSTVYGFYIQLKATLEEEVELGQQKNLEIAAILLKRDFPDVKLTFDEKAGDLVKIESTNNLYFYNHTMIDEIGTVTGETATVFLWDEKTQDYWRKTTNIIKDDGKRAIGTPLGKTGKVYPIIKSGRTFEGQANILGKDYYTLYKPVFLKGTNRVIGILYVGLEKAKFDDYLSTPLRVIITMASIIAIIGLVIITFSIRIMLTKNINAMTEQMTDLAAGNHSIDIMGLDRYDEIGAMARAVQVFKENAIAKVEAEKKQKEAELQVQEERKIAMKKIATDFDSQVGGLITSLASASTQLQSTAESMRGVADKTSTDTSSVANSSATASENVNTVASAMEEMSASSTEIAQQMGIMREKSSDTASNASEANTTVTNLNELVENIGEVVVSIRDIAEQTNLLALNATIEAARAGESGKGFAVVADEVKKLASETAEKTEEINSRIIEVQEATKASVSAMERVIGNISEIDSSVTNVSAAVDEQNATTSEIARSVGEASQGVQQVSQIILNVQQGANETGLSSDTVLSAAREVAKLSDNLQSSVNLFLAEIQKD